MRTYVAPEGLAVSGTTTLSFVENVGSGEFEDLIAKHNLNNIDTEKWYPVQQVFDLFNDMTERAGGIGQVFVAMGMKIAEQSDFPPELKQELTLIGILEGWQEHYAVNHRGADLPPVTTKKLGDSHYQLVLRPDHLYPYDLVYGMAYGFCKLLLPKGTKFVVKYADDFNPYKGYSQGVVIDVSW
jgi:hypothetical protein